MKIYASPISFRAIRVDNKIKKNSKEIESNLFKDLPEKTEIAFLENYNNPSHRWHSFIIKGLPKRVEPGWCKKIKEFGLRAANIIPDEGIAKSIQFKKISELRPSFLEKSFTKFTESLSKYFPADETRRILGAIYEAAEITERKFGGKCSLHLNPEILDARVARRLLDNLERECKRLNKELFISEQKLKQTTFNTNHSIIDKIVEEAREKVEKLQNKKLNVMYTAGFYVNILNALGRRDFLNQQQILIITLLKNAIENSSKSGNKVSLSEIKDNIITIGAEMEKSKR